MRLYLSTEKGGDGWEAINMLLTASLPAKKRGWNGLKTDGLRGK